MPFTLADARSHKHGMSTAQARRWVNVANKVLEACLKDGGTDETCAPQAIRQANGVVGKTAGEPWDFEAPSEQLYQHLCKQKPLLRYTLGVVYEPLAVDSQDDFATAETIRRAAWSFMQKLQAQAALSKRTLPILTALLKAARERTPIKVDISTLHTEILKATPLLGDQHATWDEQTGTIVECYTMPCDVELGGQEVSEGTWMLGVVWCHDYFAKILAGERTGYSLGGWARRRFLQEVTDAV